MHCSCSSGTRYDSGGSADEYHKHTKTALSSSCFSLVESTKVIRHENDDCSDLFGSERAFVLRMDRCDACKTGIPCHCLFGACSPCNQNTGCVHSQARERPCSLSVHRKLDTQTCSGMRNSKNETPASHLLATTWMEGHFSRWIKS